MGANADGDEATTAGDMYSPTSKYTFEFDGDYSSDEDETAYKREFEEEAAEHEAKMYKAVKSGNGDKEPATPSPPAAWKTRASGTAKLTAVATQKRRARKRKATDSEQEEKAVGVPCRGEGFSTVLVKNVFGYSRLADYIADWFI